MTQCTLFSSIVMGPSGRPTSSLSFELVMRSSSTKWSPLAFAWTPARKSSTGLVASVKQGRRVKI